MSIPLVVYGIYYLTILSKLNPSHIYFVPHSVAIMSICLYLGVMRFNIFELISMATASAMAYSREGFVLVDEDDYYLYSNPAAKKMIPGISRLTKGESVFSAGGWPDELRDIQNSLVNFPVAGEKSTSYFRASISPILTKHGKLMAKIILMGEITDTINLMKDLENAAYEDSLTGLYKRKHFLELADTEIERALRMNQSIYIGMLDLDFFKKINDTYGHAAGDMVLKTTAGVIRQTIRAYDLIGRYGGEELVFLFTDLEEAEAFCLMERIRENMGLSSTSYEGMGLRVTCSIGFAKLVENDTLEDSIKKADEALYAAKNAGRDQVKLYGKL
jgi:diguanylate cyclase (GGDEF)-like protein